MIEQFNAAQLRRGLMQSTVSRREADLRKFERWLDPTPLSDATVADLESFLECRGWAAPTTYAFLSHMHAFFRWAIREGVAEMDPTVHVDRPRLRQGLPRPISDDELAILIAQSVGAMRVWIMLGAFGGLRCIEMSRLERCDIFERDDYMRVLGKGNKERIIPLHPLILRAIQQAALPRIGPMFRLNDGRPASASRISHEVGRFMRDCGVDATAHQLRHWFGTRSYQSCQDILAVAGLMGHANTSMTARYAQFSHKVATAAVLSLAV